MTGPARGQSPDVGAPGVEPGARELDLTIVVVSYECGDDLRLLLDDLAAARRESSFTVAVVDNGSGDGTPDLVRRAYPWVELESLPDNLGFGRANNRSIARATTGLLLLLNPDTRLDATALRACCDEMRGHPDVGVMTPRVVDGTGAFDRRCMRGFPTAWAMLCHLSGLDRRLRDHRSGRYLQRWLDESAPADVEAVSGAVMFCRLEALRAVGGLDERFFMYGEDIDLCLRIARAGWRIRYWPGATITHSGGGSGMSPRSIRAWGSAIGELHRIHGTGPLSRLTAGAFDGAGVVLGAIRSVRPASSRLGRRVPK